MKNNLLLIFLILSSTLMYAQRIENVRFEQEGNMINIYYDLKGVQVDNVCNTDVYCSTDGGATWGSALKCVTGAVGKRQTVGNNKKIIWDVLCEKENLTGNIKFEIRAIAINLSGTYTDSRDGQMYKWTIIGDQVWMTENLSATKFNDGSSMTLITDNSVWKDLNTPAYCYYNNSSSNSIYKGVLYNWKTVQSGKLCPIDWHVPDYSEWITMLINLAQDNNTQPIRNNLSSSPYILFDVGAIFEDVLSKLASGIRKKDGEFTGIGYQYSWWSATQELGGHFEKAWYISHIYQDTVVKVETIEKELGLSVLCVKN
jgi:uncharacterized protein (TIGR02145 family)